MTEAASGTRLERSFSIEIEEDPATGETLAKFLDGKIPTYSEKKTFTATFQVQDFQFQKWINVEQSIDPTSDEKIMRLIETFEYWEKNGNQKLRILFNKRNETNK